MAKFVKIIVILFLLTCCYSCKNELTHYYVSDAFKRWTVFENGSYWIFVNDSTSAFDSVFVIGNPTYRDIPPYSSNDNFTLENIEMKYSSVFLFSTSINLREGGGETFYMRIYNQSFYSLIASASDSFIPFYENANEGSMYQLVSSDSVFFLGPKKYHHVVCTKNSFNGKNWICWFARDIGLIKIVGENTNPGFSWSLKRYYVSNFASNTTPKEKNLDMPKPKLSEPTGANYEKGLTF